MNLTDILNQYGIQSSENLMALIEEIQYEAYNEGYKDALTHQSPYDIPDTSIQSF